MKSKLLAGAVLAAGLAFAGAASADDIKIGVAGPLTGPNAAFGAQLQKGTEQAIADINKAGGVLGNKFVLSLGDDVSDPKQGVSVANKFVGDGITYVVGHFNSGVTIPASEVYAENGVLMISPSATNPKVTERGLWDVFRTCGRDDQQGAVAGKYIADHFKGAKVAVLHDKTPYGQGLADETKKAMNAAGVTEVMYEGINVGDKDFSALISKMKDAGVTVTYWGGLHTEGGLIVRQMADAGLKAQFISGDGIVSDEFAVDRRPGRRRRAEHLRSRSAQQSGRGCHRQGVPRRWLRARGLHALQLRRGSGHGPGHHQGRHGRHPEGRRDDQVGRPVEDRDRRPRATTRRATARPSTTPCTSGRRAPTARSPTFKWSSPVIVF